MKKLLFVLLLTATSIVAIGQETFVRKYTSFVTNVNDVVSEMKPIEVTFVFNEEKTSDIVIHGLETEKRFYKTGKVIEGKTTGGNEYQWVDCIQEKTGYKVSIQLFDPAVRIFIGNDYVEYQK